MNNQKKETTFVAEVYDVLAKNDLSVEEALNVLRKTQTLVMKESAKAILPQNIR